MISTLWWWEILIRTQQAGRLVIMTHRILLTDHSSASTVSPLQQSRMQRARDRSAMKRLSLSGAWCIHTHSLLAHHERMRWLRLPSVYRRGFQRPGRQLSKVLSSVCRRGAQNAERYQCTQPNTHRLIPIYSKAFMQRRSGRSFGFQNATCGNKWSQRVGQISWREPFNVSQVKLGEDRRCSPCSSRKYIL